MAETIANQNLNQDVLVERLASKLDMLFTEAELEQNLELVVKMGLNHELPLASICEHQEISTISSDPNLIKKAVMKSKQITLNKDQNFIQPNLPIKRNKVFVINLSLEKVKDFEDFLGSYAKKESVLDKEYLQRENNYKLVFETDEKAKSFVDWLRSTDKEYEAIFHNESIGVAIKEKFKDKIKEIEIANKQNFAGGDMNYYNNPLNSLQYNMMNMMMMNMNMGGMG